MLLAHVKKARTYWMVRKGFVWSTKPRTKEQEHQGRVS
jgi:hypothetical protein